MNAQPLVLVRDHGNVRVLTLNRPERLNAFDTPLYDAATDALHQAEADVTVHVVVLTGAGRAFSSGADRAPAVPLARDSFDRFLLALDIEKPIVCAVNGVAVGIGVTLLPHCDLVLVDAQARLRVPFTALGVAPEASSSYLLPQMVGHQQAARMLYTSDWITAGEAVDIGLALSMSAAGAVLDDAIALATRIAEYPLASLVATRRTVVAARRDAIRAAHEAEKEAWQGLTLPKYK